MAHPRQRRRRTMQLAGTLTALGVLAGCASNQDPNRASVEYRGSAPGAAQPAPGTPGIIAYDGYEAAVARDGETVAQIGSRVGITGAELGAYNGLQPETVLRDGDELVLPPRPGGYGGIRVGGAPTSTTVPSTATPLGTPTPVTGSETGSETGSLALGPGSSGGVETGGLAPAGETTTAAPTTTGSAGWSPALAAAAIDSAGTVSATPTSNPASAADGERVAAADPAAAAPVPATDGTATPAPTPPPARSGGLSVPPSAGSPLPPEPEPTARPASPELSRYQTPEPDVAAAPRAETIEQAAKEADEEAAAALAGSQSAPSSADLGISFTRPVDGPIAVPYNLSSSGTRNEGVDFDASPGTPVHAAAPGEVALVSQSLGGLGTIVLIRHRGDVLTVYGRVTDVQVGKGSRVAAGEPIGVVAPGDGTAPPRMHFEIRRGAESVNPQDYL